MWTALLRVGRVHCSTCKKDELVAFSCKKRGFCPSCGARRMAETAAHLVDHVLPDVPYRQWVLSLPYRIRFLCAYDPTCASGVRRILTRTISRHYEERARALGVVAPRSGAVVFAQRFDSALRLNLHYHGIWADGTFTCKFAKPRASFFALSQPTDKDVALLVTTIRKRVLRFLKKRGKRASSCRRSSIRDLRNSRRLAVMSLTRNAPLMADVVLDKPRLRYKNGRYLPIAPICSRLTKD